MDCILYRPPNLTLGADVGESTLCRFGNTVQERHRAFQTIHNHSQAYLIRSPGQDRASLRPSAAPDKPEFTLLPLDIIIEGIRYNKEDQTLYVISKTALYQLKGNQLSLIAKSPLSDPLVHLSFGRNQTVWVISETDVWKHTPQREAVYPNALMGEPALSKVLEDREGNIWITRWGGLSMIVNANIVNYSKGFSGKIVTKGAFGVYNVPATV